MGTPVPAGTPGHGGGRTSIRRRVGSVYESADTGEWVIEYEVICPDCGDDGGPLHEQSTEVQAVRGPYPDAAAARRAASVHSGAA